jgi:hypothetical protein
MNKLLSADKLRRLAALDLEGVAIGSAMAAAIPAVAPVAGGGMPALAVTLTVFALPIGAVLGARRWLRQGR